jgi:hypothetical protein
MKVTFSASQFLQLDEANLVMNIRALQNEESDCIIFTKAVHDCGVFQILLTKELLYQTNEHSYHVATIWPPPGKLAKTQILIQ